MANLFFMGIIALSLALCHAESGDAESLKLKSRPEQEYEILEQLIMHRPYNKNIRPVGHNGTDATVVTVNFFLRHIFALDRDAGTWKVQVTFRQQWQDDRLAFSTSNGDINRLTVSDSLQNDIWVPDTFFSHEIEQGIQHNLLKPNSAIWIYPDGTVLSSNRLTLTLSCPQIRYSREPICHLRVDSYAHTAKDIVYQWKQEEPAQIPDTMIHTPWEFEKMSDNLLPNGYSLKKFTTEDCSHVTPTVTWSCVQAVFHFKKNDVCPSA